MSGLSIKKSLYQSGRNSPFLNFLNLLKKKRGSSTDARYPQETKVKRGLFLQRLADRFCGKRVTPPDERMAEGETESKTFGDLMDWGAVLEKMEASCKSGRPGDYQDELIRVLRHNDNWRLREAAMVVLPAVKKPSAALVDEVFAILMRDDLCCDVRILAADALGRMLKNEPSRGRPRSAEENRVVRKVLEGMSRLLMDSQPPILHGAVRESINRIVNG